MATLSSIGERSDDSRQIVGNPIRASFSDVPSDNLEHFPPTRPSASTPNHNPLSLPTPPSIKPTSRARTYRIPNTSDPAVSGGLTGNTGDGVNTAANPAPDSFLWATREIAALDFLMNVPLL
jgi:hypothetical protein